MGALDSAIDAITRGQSSDPFAILGMHADGGPGAGKAGGRGRSEKTGSGVIVRTFLPPARAVSVIHADSGEVVGELSRVTDSGVFAGRIKGYDSPFAYRLRADMPMGPFEFVDAYRFGPILGDLDIHLLAEGQHLRLFEKLGAHLHTIDGVEGTAFALWAPNARRVSVVGDFCSWDGRRLPMRLRHGCGVWEIFVPEVGPGEIYKYEILGASGQLLPLKADPYGFAAEHPPRTASVVYDLKSLKWTDQDWCADRKAVDQRSQPMSIYEVHLASWKRRVEDGNRYLSYDELAEHLVPYVKDQGFTHVQMMPVSEFPFDGSWGYQPVGLYAPTSRHGDPAGFARLVDSFHRAGIGVMIDWVPGHFPSDPHGLGYFDGTHLYEHGDPRKGFHRDWNTLIYNYGRNEVRNFLLGNALYWLENFHIDGLRVDAVASMLYLDYSREEGDWIPNEHGGNENLEAIAFLRRMNELVYGTHPGCTTIAEESTAWPGVSQPVYLGGLGFGFKWNMGWMHDTLEYMSQDPIHRRYHHHEMTFGLLYAFTENFVLPLSHDEVVHGKGSLLGKMPGDRWQKFANLRAYYGFMWTHPGKKLLFMGGEIAQAREWDHNTSIDWHLLEDSQHAGVQALIRDLNALYRDVPALHALDCEGAGFQWIEGGDSDNSVFSYIRWAQERASFVVVVVNMTPVVREGYRIGVPAPGGYRTSINTDDTKYGGSGTGNPPVVEAVAGQCHGQPCSLSLTLPPLATVVLELATGH